MDDISLNKPEKRNEKLQLTSNQKIEFIFMPITLIGGCGGAIMLAERLIPDQANELILWSVTLGFLIGTLPALFVINFLRGKSVDDIELVIRRSIYITAIVVTGIGILIMNRTLNTELLLRLLSVSLGVFSVFVSSISIATLMRTHSWDWLKTNR